MIIIMDVSFHFNNFALGEEISGLNDTRVKGKTIKVQIAGGFAGLGCFLCYNNIYLFFH